MEAVVTDIIIGQMSLGVRVCKVPAGVCVKPLQLSALCLSRHSCFVSSPVELPPSAQVSVAKTTNPANQDLQMHFSVFVQKMCEF